jgi:hypothetical protein
MNINTVLEVILCTAIEKHQCFGGTCDFRLQARKMLIIFGFIGREGIS